ncbi:KAT8 regulatory NSL complex subunit 2 isoform X2 [Anoplophora glabripennis]|nr:KAT8 regulatory NSL complex subunit 2 isoform X2 [Anoplophora glabripennis]
MKIKAKAHNMSTKPESDAAAALRAELEIELQNKKQCSYETYECTQLTLDGFKYCSKHILQDKNAPFKQCSFVYTNNGKRCHLPAPRGDKKDYGYCNEHALKATLSRNKQNSKYPPPNTAEVLLQSLSHYVKKPRNRATYPPNAQHTDEGDRTILDDVGEAKVTKSLDPFMDLDASSIYNKQCSDVLDFCSESESDVEASTFASVWHDAQGDSSDNESIDSEQEDVLKHANVYTAEEITLVTRDKLIRLQSLYIEQYRHLQHMLREKRKKFLHSLKREKETCCNIYNQVRDNPKEQRLYKKLKAYNNYHKAYGVDAILNKRLRDLRAKITDGVAPKGHSYSKCLFTEGGVKCGERTLPLARHCRKHILEDPNQVLFKACGKINGDVECNTPIEAIFDDSMCRLHMDIPPLRSYNQPRKDSESDPDDSAEAVSHFPLFNESVKTELIDYSLSQEIPKMETVPSMLFEETQSMVTDSQDQARNSPLPPEMLFNGMAEPMNIVDDLSNISKSNDEEIKMDSSQITCGYEQEQISHNLDLEENPLLDESEVKPNLENSQINIEMENALDELSDTHVEVKQDNELGSKELIGDDIDTKVSEEKDTSLGECNEVNAIPEMEDLNIDKSENLLEQS